MRKNSQSYSESLKERTFQKGRNEKKSVEELGNKIKNILVNNSAEKASEILVQLISDFLEQQNAKSRKRRATALGPSGILVLALGVSWVLEYLFNQNISGYWTMIIRAAGQIFLIILSDILFGAKGVCYRKNKQEGIFEAMFCMLREFVGRFSEMTAIHLLMSIISIFILGGLFAQFSLVHRLVEFCKNGSYAFVCFNSSNDMSPGGLNVMIKSMQLWKLQNTGKMR